MGDPFQGCTCLKGVIFLVLEETIVEEFGVSAWQEILDEAGSDGDYTTWGYYSDEELVDLVDAAEPHIGASGQAALRWVGQHALGKLAQMYPSIFRQHPSTREFVVNLNDIIHPEVEKLYPGANTPIFEYGDEEENPLVVRYTSDRGLCSFAEGLILGTADWYEEEVEIDQSSCMHEGDPDCTLHLTFADAEPT